eukprot:TRINITY_DN39448_c0_g1_i1.p1 TRINITY_DN39448_c0_g1~~TRINITY_DN39448_c0_g1_i1.p1  ORF type:complete len:330 (-),score=57.85 TRINITY_DN39448_c0_g1_i1:41-1030(-)
MALRRHAESAVASFTTAIPGDGSLANKVPALKEIEPLETQTREQLTLDAADNHSTIEFEVCIEKGDRELGIDVVQQDQNSILIDRVKPGSTLQRWNLMHPKVAVQPGDRIVGVNSIRGSADDLISAVRTGTTLHLTIRRVEEFLVTLNREPRLGIDVSQHSTELEIQRVTFGTVHHWNTFVSSHLAVRAGDSIRGVNGVRGTSADLLAAIKSSGPVLTLTLRRGQNMFLNSFDIKAYPGSEATAEATTSQLHGDGNGDSSGTFSPRRGAFAGNDLSSERVLPLREEEMHDFFVVEIGESSDDGKDLNFDNSPVQVGTHVNSTGPIVAIR